jgi:hypothetical protein
MLFFSDTTEFRRNNRHVESGPPEFATALKNKHPGLFSKQGQLPSFLGHPVGGAEFFSTLKNSRVVIGLRATIQVRKTKSFVPVTVVKAV